MNNIYNNKEQKSTSRSVRFDRNAYREKLYCCNACDNDPLVQKAIVKISRSTFALFLRKRKREEEIRSQLWRVKYGEISFITNRRGMGSRNSTLVMQYFVTQ